MADINLLTAELRKPAPSRWFDLRRDNTTDQEDHRIWVKQLKHTWYGDADLNGEFDHGDVVLILKGGQYDDGVGLNSTSATGDWNADAEFDRADIVLALQDGGYGQRPRAALATAVPEPGTWTLAVIGLVLWLFGRRTCAI